jgi:hypothetical protein
VSVFSDYFYRDILWGPCPRCGGPTAIGFAGETPEEPTVRTRCRAAVIAAAIVARGGTGPCARCQAGCTRYGPYGSPLCDGCRAARPSADPSAAADAGLDW